MLCDAELNRSYTKACKRNGIKGNAYLWNVLMLRARKMGKLPKATQRGPLVTFEQMDAYSFASEIAMRMMEIEFGRTLDDVLCWPELAQEFDRFAKLYAPDRTEFELRRAALAIRKRASKSRSLAEKNLRKWRQKRLPKSIAFSSPIGTKYDQAGVYVVEGDQQRLYVGETSNLRRRLQGLQESQAWRDLDPTSLRILRWDRDTHAFQSLLVNRHAPLLNTQLLVNSTLQRQLLQKQ